MKKALLTVLSMHFFFLAGSQTYTSRWQYSYGGDQQDLLTTMIPLPGGQFFFAGMSASSKTCTRNSTPLGGEDFVAMLFDNSGNKLWERAYGGDQWDQLHDAIRVPSGGYILVGETRSGPSGNKTSALAGGSDLWVVRIDDFGSLLWEKSFGRPDIEIGTKVVSTTDGGFLIGGLSLSNQPGYNNGVSDYEVWKIDATGNLQWTKLYGGSGKDELYDLKSTSDGNYFISGESLSPADGTKTAASLGGADIWINKIRPDGSVIWDRVFGSGQDDFRGRLTPLSDGNMLIVENSVGMGRLQKISSDGQLFWETTCVNKNQDFFEVAAEDPVTRNLYVGGSSNTSADGCKASTLVGGGVSDDWVTTYDSSGHKMEDMDFGGNDADLVTDIDYVNGEIWVTGWSDSPLSGNKTTPNCGNTADGWILRLYRKFYISSPSSLCNTLASGMLQYSTVADFLPGNRFTVQLSDAKGDFTHAHDIGSLDAVHTDSIPFLLPAGLRSGSGYRLRIYTSAPTDTSFPFPFNILGPPENLLGPDTALCAGASMVLSTGTQFLETTFLWQDNSILNTQVVTKPGLYWCEATNGCGAARDSILLTYKDRPIPDIGPDTSFCAGSSLLIRSGPRPPDVFLNWNTGDTARDITVTTGGIYVLQATNACGTRADSIQIAMHPFPVIPLGKDSVICSGTSRYLDAGPGQASYLWNTGDTVPGINVNTIGRYWVTVTDMRGCNASDTVDIRTRVDPPVGFLPSDTAICSYGTLRLTPRNGYSEYLWNNGEAGHFLVADQPGLYSLQVRDAWGCQGRDTVVVSLKDCGKGLFVPTAFTPNHDGINDGFHPLLHGSWSSFRCTVYDRFGKLVFRTDDPREAWDGNIRGVPAPSGTFTWVCSFTLMGESIQTRKGTVVLIR